MPYFILLLSLLVYEGHAQSKVAGLGKYSIGVTTPDSLNGIAFKEQEQLYVKGTLTLVCTHIRTFTVDRVEVDGIPVANLSLIFYDNTLFRISCEYNDELQKAFVLNHGKGIPRPIGSLSFCDQGNDKPMLIKGEVWQNGDLLALAIRAKGYNADCRMEQATRLIIANKQVSALSSDCNLQRADPFAEEFDKLITRGN